VHARRPRAESVLARLAVDAAADILVAVGAVGGSGAAAAPAAFTVPGAVCIYRTGLYPEFLVDLREQLETVWGEVNPVVAFAVGEYEADGGSLSCGFLLEDDRVGCE
jgi:hypothetical protein